MTFNDAVSTATLNALAPPVPEMMTYSPSAPMLRSQARKVIASLAEPLRSRKGTKRNWAVGPRSKANSLVWLLISVASIVIQFDAPSSLYCQEPKRGFNPVMAIASAAGPSGSVILPSTINSATVTPLVLSAPSKTLPNVGLADASKDGASFTEATVTVNDRLKVALSAVVERSPSGPPSSTLTVIVEVPHLLGSGAKLIAPVELGVVYTTLGVGINVGLLLVAVILSGWDSPAPAVIPVRLTVCNPESSLIVMSLIGSNVGGALGIFTNSISPFCPGKTKTGENELRVDLKIPSRVVAK